MSDNKTHLTTVVVCVIWFSFLFTLSSHYFFFWLVLLISCANYQWETKISSSFFRFSMYSISYSIEIRLNIFRFPRKYVRTPRLFAMHIHILWCCFHFTIVLFLLCVWPLRFILVPENFIHYNIRAIHICPSSIHTLNTLVHFEFTLIIVHFIST